jgi:hypothetical protein
MVSKKLKLKLYCSNITKMDLVEVRWNDLKRIYVSQNKDQYWVVVDR